MEQLQQEWKQEQHRLAFSSAVVSKNVDKQIDLLATGMEKQEVAREFAPAVPYALSVADPQVWDAKGYPCCEHCCILSLHGDGGKGHKHSGHERMHNGECPHCDKLILGCPIFIPTHFDLKLNRVDRAEPFRFCWFPCMMAAALEGRRHNMATLNGLISHYALTHFGISDPIRPAPSRYLKRRHMPGYKGGYSPDEFADITKKADVSLFQKFPLVVEQYSESVITKGMLEAGRQRESTTTIQQHRDRAQQHDKAEKKDDDADDLTAWAKQPLPQHQQQPIQTEFYVDRLQSVLEERSRPQYYEPAKTQRSQALAL